MSLFEDVARLYEEDVRVPGNNVCKLRCDARYKRPLLPWHIGEWYETDPYRLVIIGKPHREDEPTEGRASGIQDGRRTADRLFRTKPWPFWSHTREALKHIFGSAEAGWQRIVLTTIVKCTNATGGAESNDQTSWTMKDSCIRDLGLIRQELAILEPRTIVLYTGKTYDEWVPGLCWRRDQSWRDVTHRMNVVLCGSIPLQWWEGEMAGGGGTVRVLRVGHPQGKARGPYVGLLSDWIVGASPSRAVARAERDVKPA